MMKNLMRVTLFAVGSFLAFSVSGNAQVSQQYKAHIPFDFTVGSKVIKSGDYLIKPLEGSTNQRSVIIQNASNGKAQVIGQTAISSTFSNKQGSLTFVKSGEGWALQNVLTSGFDLNLNVKSMDATNIAAVKKTGKTKTVLIGQ